MLLYQLPTDISSKFTPHSINASSKDTYSKSVLLIAFIVAATHLLIIYRDNIAAQREYQALRDYAPSQEVIIEPSSNTNNESITNDSDTESHISESTLHLLEINKEYIGWIRIDGTNIDYPMAQAENNFKYLQLTFAGEENVSGAIFMDFRVRGFNDPFVLIHGHNVENGTMFAELEKFLDESFLEEYSEISIHTVHDKELIFRVFDVKIVDVSDEIFELIRTDRQTVRDYLAAINAPQDTEQLLVLSTCFGDDDKYRLLILARPT